MSATVKLTTEEIAEVKEVMSEFSRNGKVSIGLEVGTDAGLSNKDYTQIPDSMERVGVFRLTKKAWEAHCKATQAAYSDPVDFDESAGLGGMTQRAGWIESEEFAIFDGRVTVREMRAQTETWYDVEEAFFSEPTIESIVDFVVCNWNAMTGVDDDDKPWVIAVRYWAVVMGLVCTTKNREFRKVQRPGKTAIDAVPQAPDVVRVILKYKLRAALMATVRGQNWRKTNHATAGRLGNRLIEKAMGDRWDVQANDRDADAKRAKLVTAFYQATHAISVHAILSGAAPKHLDHWARGETTYGFTVNFKAESSIQLRLDDLTGVSGAAKVADTVKILGTVIADNLSPTLEHADQIGALVAAYARVEAGGLECHVGAEWWFREKVGAKPRIGFSQDDPSYSALQTELAIIARCYYPNTTIAQSPVLAGLARNAAGSSTYRLWEDLHKARKAAGAERTIAAVEVIHGTTSAGVLAAITSSREEDVEHGVDDFNKMAKDHATVYTSMVKGAKIAPPSIDLASAVARAKARADSMWVAK